MLLNGVHLLPDLSGALICPKERLVAVSDPLADGAREPLSAPTDAVRRLAAVLRQRRPAMVLWLGSALPRLLAQGRLGRREADELARMAATHDWVWVAEDLPEGLPGRALPEIRQGSLTFRHRSALDSRVGEVSASPWPMAVLSEGEQAVSLPCFVLDGRRMVLPAFGPRPAGGTDVLSPAFQPLFRRPFTALLLGGGRILTRSRAKLLAAVKPARGPHETEPVAHSRAPRMSLFPPGD